ncbi:hypothetical protein BATDEDRAFT_14086 [Batrachochytrium dendrobatidis JAM81]|uniref:Protein SYM1 n=1 Tax=Batrachochytrium dendrobatidis (strain JAM81 / FGSC 10211) TaxID=684364 RepID=F4PB70_BATDJ|nr:uncharacterized protein BATDEDRAFT_14086 [Batrachochytrium dendrobatidis JAM81]EGF77271.1 hypothetical protein BATDEDRAFT_14086 [Batrachochytrium dendrobatidis JAM81]KAJ8327775.1 Protein required for ethanol metabolism [Batrachochytrium dendrobatidis]KAK5669406.1 Protein required for ethanol metabolism [Batrachochytrium dendrobatidis]|eukprot:XP_006681871.1 hypothetical protein BATDEDRAFT_14086 [Batrachochytrium dendrobatidis JAM81]
MFVFRWYSKHLKQRPMLTQALTTGVLFGTGDVIAQVGVEQTPLELVDLLRVARQTAFGTTICGPAMVKWYGLLNRRIRLVNPFQALLARVSLDQLLFAPTFIGIFFAATGIMENRTMDEIKAKLVKGYPDALIGNYQLWPAVQLINFYVVPVHHQALFVNVIALGWNTYLSVLNRRSGLSAENIVVIPK